jgi:S-formylglutathione hydrolase FrmB
MFSKVFFIILILSSVNIFSQDTLFVNADYIPHTDTTLVFVPSNYNPANSYPMLFMLHGYSGNYAQWNLIINLDSVAKHDGIIIVCPDGFYDSWYVNSPLRKNSQYEKFFFENLVPALFQKYSIDKKNIFITGLSMGGHGAIYLFLHHPDFFRSAGSTSGILDLTAFPENWSLPKIFGSYTLHQNTWRKNSDIALLNAFKDKKREFIVDCGTEDFAFNVNKSFYETCLILGVHIKFISGPGAHTKEYWAQSVKAHLAFFNSLINRK